MMNFFAIISLSVIVEGLITYINMFKTSEIKYQMLLSMLLGVIVSLAYNLDLLSVFGLEAGIPYIGSILTGILLSRGSNYMSDIIKSVTNHNNEYKLDNR